MSETFIDIDPEKDAQAKKEFEALYVAHAIRYNDFVHEEKEQKKVILPTIDHNDIIGDEWEEEEDDEINILPIPPIQQESEER
ncbi:MAG: hypothetical protein MK035_04315 [Dehalococcoidia bacterium]|nr:hypothetical protein [Dehalococcoidia bacterium]